MTENVTPTADGRRGRAPGEASILLITADLKTRALAEPALLDAGFQVLTTANAGESLELAEQISPDVILLDLLVNDTDALSLRQTLRRLPPCQSTPVFVLSDLVDRGLVAQVYKDPFSEFLPKPVNWLVLPHRLRQAVVVGRSVAALREYQRSLEQAQDAARSASTEALKLRSFDQLTGLPNRATFTEIVALAVAQMRNRRGEIAVLFIDIDSFRELNDSLGREGGDVLLRAIAGRLQSTLEQQISRPDEVGSGARGSLARIQADEFAILLDQIEDVAHAVRLGEEILAALTAPYGIGGRDVFVSASMGIAVTSDAEGEAVLQCAETAMRHAKRDGAHSMRVYTDEMRSEVEEKIALQERLRLAIDNNELRLHYQPIVDSRTRRIKAVEGLVRWTDAQRGPVPPDVFIPIAEESGLITRIGDWVLREGCRQLAEWRDAGISGLRLALNIARPQLEEAAFVDKVQAALASSAIEPASLELELSERGVLRDDPATLDKLARLEELGVSLAIDDFGTGQTTLAYLQRFPLRVLKIDRSFVSRVATDPATEAITRAIIAMAHELQLRVVGEGVETEAQESILRKQQCDELQGFLFHRPVRARELQVLINDRAPEAETQKERPEEIGLEVEPEPATETVLGPSSSPHSLVPAARHDPDSEPFPTAEILAIGPEAEDELFRMAHVDFLTDLLNRYSFERSLEATLARAQRFGHRVALLLFDLDQFKAINDTFGHAAGDELLKVIAARLKRKVRKVDALARLGGDEFALVHSEFRALDGLGTLAQRLGEEISKPIRLGSSEVRITASIGIAVFPPGDADPGRFYRQADLALYKAKEEGGNRFHFHASEMDRQVQIKLQLGRDLHGATERDELHLVFQPQFALATRAISAVEALVRWNHPSRGMVPPGTFIPIAEDNGEIIPIGEWVLRNACAEAGSWHREIGLEIPVSVNLSYVQFRLQEFPNSVRRILEETQLPAHLLELELNQRMLLRLESDLERLVRGLESLGVSLCIDDFGTGPFSMEDLSHLPFRKLKVDGRFVRIPDEDGKCPPLVSAIIALGKKLNLGVVAEGVETQAQLRALQDEQCDFAQGHLFTRPMSAPEMHARLLGVGLARRTSRADILPFPNDLSS